MRDKWDAEEEAVWNAHRQPCSLILKRRLPRQKDLLQKVELETLLATFFGSCGTGLPGLSWATGRRPSQLRTLMVATLQRNFTPSVAANGWPGAGLVQISDWNSKSVRTTRAGTGNSAICGYL